MLAVVMVHKVEDYHWMVQRVLLDDNPPAEQGNQHCSTEDGEQLRESEINHSKQFLLKN